MAAQSRVTFPSREEEFSHELAARESVPLWGEVSPAPLPERLRNVMQNENALLSGARARVLAL